MSEDLLLLKFKKDVNNLIGSAKKVNLNDLEIQGIFLKCFHLLNKKEQNNSCSKNSDCKRNNVRIFFSNIIKIIVLISIFVIFIYILLNVHQPTASLVLRNVQGLIYPGLKVIRFLAVPVIEKFPSLTDFYDESCLLENPYFYVHNMECWPCQNIYSAIETSGVNFSIQLSGIPYLTKTSHKPVPYKVFKNFYTQSNLLLNEESTSFKISTLKELFNQEENELIPSNIHISLRINKMYTARVLRNLFPTPEFLPDRSGQSVERYIMIDCAKALPYSLPNTECSSVSLRQVTGQRTIVLKPSPECNGECRTVSISLHSSDILWYNWLYWRPISLPTENSTEISISYMNSYC